MKQIDVIWFINSAVFNNGLGQCVYTEKPQKAPDDILKFIRADSKEQVEIAARELGLIK